MNRGLFRLGYLGVVVFLVCGCALGPGKGPGSGSTVVATVNNRAITLEQLNAGLRSLPRNSSIDPNTSLGRRSVLDTMINQELLLQEAKKAAIPERKDIKEAIKAQSDQLVLNQLIYEKFGRRLDVTDEETEAYYGGNKESFVMPERRHVRHILVDREEMAEKVKKELSEGADFEELVEEYAVEEGKKNGGDLGYIEKSNIIPEFGDAAFSLKLDEVGGPVKTQLGYHVIQVLDIKEPEQLDFDSVRDAIKRLLMLQKQEALVGSWVNEIKAKADITVKGSELARSSNYQLETLSLQPREEKTEETAD